jgi:hypothetical protein
MRTGVTKWSFMPVITKEIKYSVLIITFNHFTCCYRRTSKVEHTLKVTFALEREVLQMPFCLRFTGLETVIITEQRISLFLLLMS